ncbi:MAG: hypothetical protein JW929_15815 [Anaerolineales bacterium]|nr:hypothetical protein [Anaerolineales bacterium]
MGRLARFAPTLCAAALAAAYLGWVLLQAGGDPMAFAFLGTRFSEADPSGSDGYDGQFNYYIARDPDPQGVAPRLDVPAYRYQHILYPLLARTLALGIPAAIPWTLVGVNFFSLLAATFVAGELLHQRGGSRGGGLAFGLWAGLVGAVRLDLSEPLALLLVLLALWISGPSLDRRILAAASLLGLAMLAKETMIPFVAGWAAWLISRRRSRDALLISASLLPFALMQIWLWRTFGSPGIGSGGADATPFEWIPFAGLFRIGQASLPALAAMSAVYLPGLLVPAVYGLAAPACDLFRRRISPESLLLAANAAVIAFAPYSTFREPLGILRLACGLVLCMGLYAAAKRQWWWNKLRLVGLAYLVFLR